MRHRQLPVIAVAIIAFTAPARADDCLDASERARTELEARRLLAARSYLRRCAASACDDLVRSVCEERLGEIAQRVATVVFDFKDGDGRDLTNVALTIDDTQWNEPPGAEITLDPGPHTFAFRWHDRMESRTFVLLEREKGRRETIAFPSPHVPETPPPVATAPIVVERAPTTWRTLGAITMGAGAIGLGIGSAFGVVAIGKNADANCDSRNVCDDPRSRHDARISANISTGAFITGGLLAAAGVVLFFFGPKR